MFDEIFILVLDRKIDQVTIHEETGWHCTNFLVGDGRLKDRKYGYIDEVVAGRAQAWNYTKSIHALVRYAQSVNISSFLLFEDDACVTKHFTKNIQQVSEEFAALDNWDLFYLGSNCMNGINTRITNNIIKSNYILDWHAVIINYTAYDTILSIPPSTEHTFDGLIAERMRKGFLNAYSCWPSLITQKSGWSSNENRFIDRSINHNI